MITSHGIIKVLVADDSALMRKILSDIINSDETMEVVATARNGQDAYEKILKYSPDVVTLDVEMPVMDGLATLEKIMKEHPLPVVMLSALTQNGASATIKALEKGAVDFISKPGGSISVDIGQLKPEIINKIKCAAGISLNKCMGRSTLRTVPKPRICEERKQPPEEKVILNRGDKGLKLVAIGTSTGGPKALHEVMSHFKTGFNAAVLIVQHMPPGFTKSLAQRLDSISEYSVKEAEDGDEIKGEAAYLAPGSSHMEVVEQRGKYVIKLNQNPPVNGHRPAADVMMEKVAKIPLPKIGVIMTGMGSDGAKGMKSLKEAGAVTIGESAETCVVYGMPKSAYKLGVIDHEVPLYKIADTIMQALNR